MSAPKLPFSHLPLEEKVMVTEDLVSDLRDDPDFPSPNPSLSALERTARELKHYVREIHSGDQVTAEAKSRELEEMISALLSYVHKASGGDPQKYLKLRHIRESKKGRRQKRSFLAKAGVRSGEVILRGPAGAILWQMCPDPLPEVSSGDESTKWKSLPEQADPEYLVKGLESGTRVWFRMARVDRFGHSPFSSPASVRVP